MSAGPKRGKGRQPDDGDPSIANPVETSTSRPSDMATPAASPVRDSTELLIEIAKQATPGIELGLERMERLLRACGSPHTQLPPVVHVAGTNGKGSTLALLRAMLEAAGHRVNAYHSPSIPTLHHGILLAGPADTVASTQNTRSTTQRTAEPPDGTGAPSDPTAPSVSDKQQPVAGDAVLHVQETTDPQRALPVDEPRLAAALSHVLEAMAMCDATAFEAETVAAFLLMAENPSDVCLLETGLGGRLDATNVVPRPAVSAIASIGLDHTEFLGTKLEDIAFEKAGILKPGTPCILSDQPVPVRDVFEMRSVAVGAPLLVQNQDWTVHEEHGRMVYQGLDALFDLPLPALPGRHQIGNAGLAIAAARELGALAPDEAAIARGLQSVTWASRLQRLPVDALGRALPQGSELWIDGGHNPAAATALANEMAELEERDPKPLHLVVAMLGTKDVRAFLEPFVGLAERVLAPPIPDVCLMRATAGQMPSSEIVEAATLLGIEAHGARSLSRAFELSACAAGDDAVRVLVCGSLHLAAATEGFAQA